MLKVYKRYIDEVPDCDIINDVEHAFEIEHNLKFNEKMKQALVQIDGVRYIDDNSFMDAYGYKISMQYLSTGCKTAILLLAKDNICIDTIESGFDAISVMMDLCKDTNNSIIVTDINSILGGI